MDDTTRHDASIKSELWRLRPYVITPFLSHHASFANKTHDISEDRKSPLRITCNVKE